VIDTSTVKWLANTPASDLNFKSALKRANAEEIREAIAIVETRRETKTKLKALNTELRKRGKAHDIQ